MLAAWETSAATGDLASYDSSRKLKLQTLDATTGSGIGTPCEVTGVKGNRYQEFPGFPDGSVAHVAPGSTSTKLKILRVLPCN